MNTNTVRRHVDLDTTFDISHNVKTIYHKGKILMIVPETGKWIIIENENQLQFFNCLRSNSIREAIRNFDNINNDDVKEVLIQIVAKQFDSKIVHSVAIDKMQLYLTNACNLHCPHCYMYSGVRQDNELTLEEIKELLRNYKIFGGLYVTMTGGEICTRKDLISILKYAKELGLLTDILTNGTLWNDELVNNVANLVNRVQISVDGYNEIVNAKIRGKGNWKKSLDAVEKFLKHGVKTEIAITPAFDNDLNNSVYEYVKFGNKLMDKYKNKDFLIHFNGELLEGRDIHLSDKESSKYTEIMEHLTKLFSGYDSDDSFVKFHKEDRIQNNCLFGTLNVSAVGDVYACPAISCVKPFANIRVDNFSHIFDLSRKIKELSDVANIEPCKNCELIYICGGGCRYKFFPKLINIPQDYNIKEYVPKRKCSVETKEQYYDLMIKTNKRLFV